MACFSRWARAGLDSSYVKRLAKNLVWLICGNFGALVIGFFVNAYLARKLGQNAFGIYNYAQTIALYAAMMVDCGLNAYGNRATARDPARAGQLLINIAAFQLILGTCVVVLSVSVVNLFPPWPADVRPVVVMSLLWLFPFALNIEWLHLGFQRMRAVALGRLFQQVVICLSTLLLVVDSGSVIWAPLARVIGGVASAGWLLWQLPPGIFGKAKMRLRQTMGYIRSSRWFWMSSLFVQIYHGSDILILQMTRSPAEVGQYSAGFRLMSMGIAVIALINVWMFPILSAEYGRDPGVFRHLRKMYYATAGVISGIILGVGLPLAPRIVLWVYGDEYRNTMPILQILMIAAAVLTINGALSQPLLAAGSESGVFWQILFTAVVNVVLNLSFIPSYGAAAAAGVYLASQVFGTLWLFFLYRRRMKGPDGGSLVEGPVQEDVP
ncbi:MAG: flippase [Acidobacteria bacterium]|nr:flippase [Acidobacteriota bacterium]